MSHVAFNLRKPNVALSLLRNVHHALSNFRNVHVSCHYLFRSHGACHSCRPVDFMGFRPFCMVGVLRHNLDNASSSLKSRNFQTVYICT